MLWPSISRWKFQRSRIGKFAASAWCFRKASRATTSGLAAMIEARNNSLPRSFAQNCAGSTAVIQSTTCPSIEKSSASNIAMTAVLRVMPSRIGRIPCEHAQMKATKPRGGERGTPSGYG
jgi:hypothetical protein